MIQLSNDLNKGNTTASQVIKEELPFDVYAYGIRQFPNMLRFADKSRRLDRSCQGFTSFQVQCICTHRKMAWCKYIAPCHTVIALGLALFASVLRCAQSAPQTLPPTFYIPTVLPRRTVPTPHTLPLSAPHSGRGNTPLFCRPG